MNIGDKLKHLREYYGYSQNELSKVLGVPQRSISNYEAQDDVAGLLEYIFKVCTKFNIPVSQFFLEDEQKNTSKSLPDYITHEQAELLKILNTKIDVQTRIQVTKIFIEVMKGILLQQKDKFKHLPEFQELFGDIEYKEPEEKTPSDLSKVADGEKKD